MVCTDTDHYVNTLSAIKNKRKKSILNAASAPVIHCFFHHSYNWIELLRNVATKQVEYLINKA